MSHLKIWLAVLAIAMMTSCSLTPPTRYAVGIRRPERVVRLKVDRRFLPAQRASIWRAMREWEDASGGRIRFEAEWNRRQPGPYWMFAEPQPRDGLFLWSLTEEDRRLAPDPPANWALAMGVMVYGRGEDSGNVVLFETMPEEMFHQVALHELGHLLGLGHAERGAWSVMEPSAKGTCLSLLDRWSLCTLYGCVPEPGCSGP